MTNKKTENVEAANESNQQTGMQILAQYVRDLSFENPGAPNFAAANSPSVNVSANVGARKFSDTDYEVSLKFKIEAKVEDDNVQFIAELDYCGVFRLINTPEDEVRSTLLVEAPRQLFPFARRVLADATRDGGYPPIMLDPIDFKELYNQGDNQPATSDDKVDDKEIN